MGKITKDSLGDRMKTYEAVTRDYLMLGCPKVIRLDMRAGHTFTRGFDIPYDEVFSQSMIAATKALCEQVTGVVMGYTQSDEISLVINDVTERGEVSCFFEGNISKITSISASICTLAFNKKYAELVAELPEDKAEKYKKNVWTAQFDSRTYCLPNVMEVHNYILWRQQDATRNSIQMAGHANFSQSELDKKNVNEIQDMLMLQKGINWNDYPVKFKRGCVVLKEQYEKDVEVPNRGLITGVKRKRWVEAEIPILTQDLEFIPKIFARKLLINGKLE